MYITTIYYFWGDNEISIIGPEEIVKETDSCFYVQKEGWINRYYKKEINRLVPHGTSKMSVLALRMIDVSEQEIREVFANKLNELGNFVKGGNS